MTIFTNLNILTGFWRVETYTRTHVVTADGREYVIITIFLVTYCWINIIQEWVYILAVPSLLHLCTRDTDRCVSPNDNLINNILWYCISEI